MNSVNENIDSRILILLGLEDVFDLDYSTYATLLKEKLIEVTRGKNKIPAAEAKLLIDEFKRVRNKEGRLKPKSKKVRVQNVTNLGNMKRLPGGGALAKYNPQTGQLLTRKEQQEEKRNQQKQNINANKISDIFSNIRDSFSNIGKTLKNQLTLDRSIQRYQRKKTEDLKREKTEELIEERKTEKKAVDRENKQKKKVGEGPLAKFIDAIKRFIGFTILGRAIKLIEDILKEEDRFNTVVKFLKDWWPALLAAYLAFTNPLVRLIPAMIALLVGLTAKLAAPLAVLAAAAAVAKQVYDMNQPGSALFPDPDNPDKTRREEQVESGGGLGVTGAPMSPEMFGFNKGGQVPDIVGGQPIMPGIVPGSGFNRDSIPALLTPGEFVMSRDAVKEFGPDVLSAMNSFRGGGLMPTMASSPATNVNDTLRKRLSNPARYRPGGVVTSNSGMKVKGNGVDTQYIQPATVQIGEAVRVFTKDSVDMGILPIMDRIEALLDPAGSNSSRMIGRSRYIPSPPMRRSSNNAPKVLDPIVQNQVSGYDEPMGDGGVPDIDVAPASSFGMRANAAQILGIIG